MWLVQFTRASATLLILFTGRTGVDFIYRCHLLALGRRFFAAFKLRLYNAHGSARCVRKEEKNKCNKNCIFKNIQSTLISHAVFGIYGTGCPLQVPDEILPTSSAFVLSNVADDDFIYYFFSTSFFYFYNFLFTRNKHFSESPTLQSSSPHPSPLLTPFTQLDRTRESFHHVIYIIEFNPEQ